MLPSRRQGGQCVFCTVRAARVWPNRDSPSQLSGARWSSKSAAPIETMSSIVRRVRAPPKSLRNVSLLSERTTTRSFAAPNPEARFVTRQKVSQKDRISSGERSSKKGRNPPIRGVASRDRSAGKGRPSSKDEVASRNDGNGAREAARRPRFRAESTHELFSRLLKEHMAGVFKDLHGGSSQVKGLIKRNTLHMHVNGFIQYLMKIVEEAEAGIETEKGTFLFNRLRSTFVNGSHADLRMLLKHSFLAYLVGKSVEVKNPTALKNISDLTNPSEWYPATRALQRKVHLHIGPTNSGKTYHALKRLQEAKTGVFAGPLRLLAHEVYTRFNAAGKLCALVTGEERRIPPGMKNIMHSCTVEMVPLNSRIDVAVIDEIQMMGDSDRGWAWTTAFLGLQAKELHVCGEVRTEQLIRNLCTLTGDELTIHRYGRLNPLHMESKSLEGKLENLRKGDAIIVFSRVGIHAMKARVEQVTGKRCAVVYGSLPPETRAQQAALFNDPDNDYDYLVASDAVGMGLNLSIRRVIFEASSKHDGTQFRLMEPFEIKQIAGRAGRYKTAHQANLDSSSTQDNRAAVLETFMNRFKSPSDENIGWVTAIDDYDYEHIKSAMKINVKPMQQAYISPTDTVILDFARHFPADTPFSNILVCLWDQMKTSPLFALTTLKDQLTIANMVQDIPMTTEDRLVFTCAPIHLRSPDLIPIIRDFASCIANHSDTHFLDFQHLDLELLDIDIHELHGGVPAYLRQAELLHSAITLYLWISYRFAGIFKNSTLAFHTKALLEVKIDECLSTVSWDAGKRQQAQKRRMRDLKMEQEQLELKRMAEGSESLAEEVDEDGNLPEDVLVDGVENSEVEDRDDLGVSFEQELSPEEPTSADREDEPDLDTTQNSPPTLPDPASIPNTGQSASVSELGR